MAWERENNLIYCLVETGEYRRGEPLMENEFTIRVDRGRQRTDEDVVEVAREFQRAVNNHDKLVEALRTLTDEFASRLDGIYDATNEEIAALDCARNLLRELES